jgi:dUTP pyrophosphatase
MLLEATSPICEPTKGSKYSAAIDLRSRIDAEITCFTTMLVPLGVNINIERFFELNKDIKSHDDWMSEHVLHLYLRSSIGKKLIIPNGIGVIDIDYKNEIMIMLHNPNAETFKINIGDRLCQIALMKHSSNLFGVKSENDRYGGFGSTGTK